MPGARTSALLIPQLIPSAIWTDIIATAVRYDAIGAWAAGAPSRLTVAQAGLHVVAADLTLASNAGGVRLARILSNNTRYEATAGQAPPAAPGETSWAMSTLVNPAIADWYTTGIYQTAGVALNTGGAAEYGTDFSLARLPAGSVGARREQTVGQAIPAGVWTTLTWGPTVFDTGGMVSGTGLIAPNDGTYVMWAGATVATSAANLQGLAIVVDGGSGAAYSMPAQSASSAPAWSVTHVQPLLAGQLAYVQAYQAAARTLDVASLRPYLAMARVGP